MRPASIIQFERLYLASLAVVIIQSVAAYFVMREAFGRLPAGADVPGMGGMLSGIMIGSIIFGLLLSVGIPLLLMWLASRKRIEVAKWLLLVVSVLSVLGFLANLVMLVVMPGEVAQDIAGFAEWQAGLVAIDGVSEALGIAALVFLFRRDSTEWFRTAAPNVNADVFR
jgi:hypothetical protein